MQNTSRSPKGREKCALYFHLGILYRGARAWTQEVVVADRYTIDIERLFPPGAVRDLANSLGATDLSNVNPIAGFMRGRDAMARGDYGEAAVETAAPVVGLGIMKLLKQPTKEALSALFGFGSPDADPSDVLKQNALDAKRFRDEFDIDAYHGQFDVETSEGITTFPDGRELGVGLELDFSVPSVSDDNLGINAFQGTNDKFDDGFTTSLGTWFGDDPDIANYFAGSDPDVKHFDGGRGPRGAVYPVKIRMKNPATFDTYDDLEAALYDFLDEGRGVQEFVQSLRDQGFDGIKVEYSTTDTGRPRSDYVTFDANQVRSRFAKFDPSKASSRNIMSSIAAAVGLGAASSKSEEDVPKYATGGRVTMGLGSMKREVL